MSRHSKIPGVISACVGCPHCISTHDGKSADTFCALFSDNEMSSDESYLRVIVSDVEIPIADAGNEDTLELLHSQNKAIGKAINFKFKSNKPSWCIVNADKHTAANASPGVYGKTSDRSPGKVNPLRNTRESGVFGKASKQNS